MHGVEGNPLTPFLLKSNIKSHATEIEAIYNSNGERVDKITSAKFDQKLWRLFDDMKDVANGKGFNVYKMHGNIHSIKDFLSENKDIILQDLNGEGEKKLFANFFMCMEDHIGENFEKVSFFGCGTDVELEGDHLVFPNGYKELLDFMIQPSIMEKVKTKQIVNQITTTEKQVIVDTLDKSYYADAVLVSVPVGVLKANSIRFNPPLPDWKEQAIERIGFGLFNKIFIQFESPFWPEDADLITLCSEAEEDFSVKEIHHSKMSIHDPFLLSFVNLKRIAGQNTIFGFFHSERARYFETLADDVVLEICLTKLRKTFGSLPKVVKFYITKWNSDPFSRGSYSHIRLGSSAQDIEILAKPIDDKIFFAGEATFPKHYSTVHGAFSSGLVAADCISKVF